MAQTTVVVLKRAHFFSMDNDIIDIHAKKIGAIGIAIYAVLARFANRKTGECWPAIARIQRTLDLGRSTVKRYLKLLEKEGLITIEERWSEDGDPTSNLYTLLNPDPAAIAKRQQTPAPEPLPLQPVTHEGGGSAENPPPVLSDGEGGSAVNPKPTLQNPTHETINKSATLAKTLQQLACIHPAPEVRSFAGITLCYHCWSMLEDHPEGNHHPTAPTDTSQAA